MTPHERDPFVERSKADPTDAYEGGDKCPAQILRPRLIAVIPEFRVSEISGTQGAPNANTVLSPSKDG